MSADATRVSPAFLAGATLDGMGNGTLRSVGAASAVRFNLWNIWRACSVCNHHMSGNVANYERNLRMLIGDAKVDWIYAQNQLVRYEVDYLRRLKAVFSKRARRAYNASVGEARSTPADL